MLGAMRLTSLLLPPLHAVVVPSGELLLWFFQGLRFDLKVSACLVLICWPIFSCIRQKYEIYFIGALTFISVLLVVINHHFLNFYKTPISPIIFGLIEDDTIATLKTIWHDYSIGFSISVVCICTFLVVVFYQLATSRLKQPQSLGIKIIVTLIFLLILLLAAKGTFRSIALQKQHTTVTRSEILNNRVLNGPIALYYAWGERQLSQKLGLVHQGLTDAGFSNPQQAAQVLYARYMTDQQIREQLIQANKLGFKPESKGIAEKNKNLIFFLMESWSAEPLRHQSSRFNVAGKLEPWVQRSCHFDNFDALQPGTHPSLEALLFSSPITPLTQGPAGNITMPWSIAKLYQQAGYRTVFLTSGRSGWRNLNQVLQHQGFDEVIDASDLIHQYPQAQLSVWGVWDEYITKYLLLRFQQTSDQPLFIFVLTTTNHPPYEYPSHHPKTERARQQWWGSEVASDVEKNLDTYTYTNDVLGDFLNQFRESPQFKHTIVAATGDHNMRTLGSYVHTDRKYLMHQVPFMIWNTSQQCDDRRHLPAHHGDIFPTLLPLMGIEKGYLPTGRNLFADSRSDTGEEPFAFHFGGSVRQENRSWPIGQPNAVVCTDSPSHCIVPVGLDEKIRARYALIDWYIRTFYKSHLSH